jgi:hypothetical protein
MCGGRHIRASEAPARQQSPVLQEKNAIVNQGVVQQQVCKTNGMSAMFRNLQKPPPLLRTDSESLTVISTASS